MSLNLLSKYDWVRNIHNDNIGRIHYVSPNDKNIVTVYWGSTMYYDLYSDGTGSIYNQANDLIKIEDQRWVIGNQLCGDVWKLRDGRYLLIDYKDGLQTGFVYSDGESGACYYTKMLEGMLKSSSIDLILRSEESNFPACDSRGWSRPNEKWSIKDSVDFLKRIIK